MTESPINIIKSKLTILTIIILFLFNVIYIVTPTEKKIIITIIDHLTIRLRARVFYEQIVNEAQPSRLWLSEKRASSLIVLV